MVRPKKSELEAKLRERGLDDFSPESLKNFHTIKRREFLELEEKLEEKLKVAEELVRFLEELRGLLCDNNVWTVVRRTLRDPGIITAEATRDYGMDHREALGANARLVEEGYIERSNLELDPIRERYVRRQYPGPRLLVLLQGLSKAAEEYVEAYKEIRKLKEKMREAAEAMKLTKKYMKYYRPQEPASHKAT